MDVEPVTTTEESPPSISSTNRREPLQLMSVISLGLILLLRMF